jgi:3-phosphoshikimate 1-carboxyvinyltransferase
VLAFSGGKYVLDGVARMRQRPIAHLVDALNSVGANISYLLETGYPPILISPSTRITSDIVHVKGNVSSQFVTGLLLSAPLVAPSSGLKIRIDGELISSPYVSLTCKLMGQFGVVVSNDVGDYVVPKHGYLSPGKIQVEADASGASYFLALGALRGPLTVEGIGRDSVQGDASFVEYLARMGASVTRGENWIRTAPPSYGSKLHGITADYRNIPDAAMTIAAIAPLCEGKTVLKGIGSWRVKETDRIAALAAELRKTGAAVETGADWMEITPPERVKGAVFDTYEDHRMAMCMSLIAAGGVAVEIRDPGCVAKTFPDYFERLNSVISRE